MGDSDFPPLWKAICIADIRRGPFGNCVNNLKGHFNLWIPCKTPLQGFYKVLHVLYAFQQMYHNCYPAGGLSFSMLVPLLNVDNTPEASCESLSLKHKYWDFKGFSAGSCIRSHFSCDEKKIDRWGNCFSTLFPAGVGLAATGISLHQQEDSRCCYPLQQTAVMEMAQCECDRKMFWSEPLHFCGEGVLFFNACSAIQFGFLALLTGPFDLYDFVSFVIFRQKQLCVC